MVYVPLPTDDEELLKKGPFQHLIMTKKIKRNSLWFIKLLATRHDYDPVNKYIDEKARLRRTKNI